MPGAVLHQKELGGHGRCSDPPERARWHGHPTSSGSTRSSIREARVHNLRRCVLPIKRRLKATVMPSRLETVLRAGQQHRQSKPVCVVRWDPPPGLYDEHGNRNPNWVDPDPPPPEPDQGPELGGNPYRLPPGTECGLGKRRGGRAPRERANDGRVAHPTTRSRRCSGRSSRSRRPGALHGVWVLVAGAGWPPDSITIISPGHEVVPGPSHVRR